MPKTPDKSKPGGMDRLAYVWTIRAPSALAKLLLIHMADNAGNLDAMPIDIGRAASFCGSTREDVVAALEDLVRARCLMPSTGGGYRLAGYVTEARPC